MITTNIKEELENFIYNIKYKNRNPKEKDNFILEMLKDKETNPIRILNNNTILYRARIFEDDYKMSEDNGFYGYSKKDSYVPPQKKTKAMRANYDYIPYLYCSDESYGALCEIRPRLGAIVSIAEITVNEELKLFDFTYKDPPKNMDDLKHELCKELSFLFSTPIKSDDDASDYVPTQYIAEYLKSIGYDGIVYECAYSNKSSNIVVFNYNKCEAISSYIYKVIYKSIEVGEIQVGEGIGFKVQSDLGDMLDELNGEVI